MSLFRPDRVSEPHDFVPLRFEATSNGFISTSDLASMGAADGNASGKTNANAANPFPEAVADELIRLTAPQLEEIEAAAYARGQAEGQQEALMLAGACAAIEKAGIELKQAAASELAANREEIVALVAATARQWVGAELRLDPGLFADLLENVLVEVEAREDAQLFLNPEELSVFSAQHEARGQDWADKFGVVLLGDPSLAAGDFRVETPIHRVDGRAEVIAERLAAALAGAVEAMPPEGEE